MKPMTIQEIYDYAKLSTLAYVDLSEHGQNDITPKIIVEEGSKTENPGNSERIPEALGRQMFDPSKQADVTGFRKNYSKTALLLYNSKSALRTSQPPTSNH